MSSDTGVILATLVCYMLTLLAIGAWASSRSRDEDSYFIGNRRLGMWVAALSYAASSSSAWAILGVTGIAYSQGLSAVWLLPGTLTGHVLVWFWLGQRLRNAAQDGRMVTLNDLIVRDLAPAARRPVLLLAAGIITFSFLFYIAAQFQGAANTFAEVFDFEFTPALLVGALVVLTYTLLGGFWAVSVTDTVQAGLMLLAALLLPTLALVEIGGPSALVAGLEAVSRPDQLSLLGPHSGLLAVGFLLGMLSIGVGPLGQPHLLNRLMALSGPAALARARLVALTWFVVVLGGMFLLGLCAHVLEFQAADPERVFFALVDGLLGPVLAGVVIAALLSAIMSTADSQLLVAASAVSHDLMGRTSVTVSRITVLVVGVLAVLVAMYLPEAIFSRVLFAWNALGAAFGPLVIARVLRFPVAGGGTALAMAVGFGLTVLFYLLPDTVGDVAERSVPFLAAGSVCIVSGLRNRREVLGGRQAV
ncbi:MAG: hypothetical protein R3E86_14815 [Pseudomonadales bacterium]